MNLRSQPWQVLYPAAESAVEHSDWLVAEPLLEQVIEQVPSHAAAHHLLGKVWREQERLEAALEAQQRSCAFDPGLGWNWFAAGELLLELERWAEAVTAFEQAQAALPAEGWIREQLAAARFLACCDGEDLAAGVGSHTYRHWIAHHEPRLPPATEGLNAPFWCLE